MSSQSEDVNLAKTKFLSNEVENLRQQKTKAQQEVTQLRDQE